MRFIFRAITGLALLGLTVAFIGYGVYAIYQKSSSTDRKSRPSAGERTHSVRVLKLTPSVVAPTLTVYGEIRSYRQLILRAPSGGEIVELSDKFRDGQSAGISYLSMTTSDKWHIPRSQ